MTMALQAATLNELSDGRLLLGVGLQARGYVEGWHGQRYERPVRAMREFVTILRADPLRRAVTFEGEIFSVRGLPAADAAARAARADLHGGDRAADDTARRRARGRDDRLLLLGRVRARRRDAEPAAGAERAGRSLDGFDVACGFPTIVTPDERARAGQGPGDDVRDRASSSPSTRRASPRPAMTSAPIQERVDAGDVDGALGARHGRDGGRDDDRRLARPRPGADRRVPGRRADHRRRSTRRRRTSGSRSTRAISRTARSRGSPSSRFRLTSA